MPLNLAVWNLQIHCHCLPLWSKYTPEVKAAKGLNNNPPESPKIGLPDTEIALCAKNASFSFFFFPRTTVFLVGPHAVCPFGMADWLNRLRAFIIYTAFLIKKKKCKKKIIGSLLHYQKQITASRGSNTEPEIVKLIALFHHMHQIVDSSQQSSPGISPKDCFKYAKFWGVDNFSYKLISW